MDPQTLDMLSKFAGPVATIVAATVAALVAITFGALQIWMGKQQLRIANDKLALDLFERRIDVYSRLREAIRGLVSTGASNAKIEVQMLEAIDGARFLFGSEVKAYLDKLYFHAVDLDVCNKEMQHATADRFALIEKRRVHFDAIADFYKMIDSTFGPYLTATHKFAAK